MKFISNNNITDPTLNLAMEEYVLKKIYQQKKVTFYFT